MTTETLIALGLGIAGGLVIGGLAAAHRVGRRATDAEARATIEREGRERAEADIASRDADLSELRETASTDRSEVARLTEALAQSDRRLAELGTTHEQQLAEHRKHVADAETRLTGVFAAHGQKALQANSTQFLELAKQTFEKLAGEARGDVDKRAQAVDAMVKPIKELLEKHERAVVDLERKRESAYTKLEENLRHVADAQRRLGDETGRLVTALRRPEQRGRWGEMQLRNAVEMAGMTEHCDFREQPQTDDPNSRDRPDMIVNLPGGGVIVVDSKVALDAYLDAIDTDASGTTVDASGAPVPAPHPHEVADRREVSMLRHAKQVEDHTKRLAAKSYWKQFEHTPQLVVMFMPLESALVAALERSPDLHTDAMRENVLIATPTLLVALLRAVAYGWQQESIAANSREVATIGRELYERLGTFADHLGRVGKGLRQATEAYNKSVGSLERTVLPSARKFRELSVVSEAGSIEDTPPLIEVDPRSITAGELLPDPTASGDAESTPALGGESSDGV